MRGLVIGAVMGAVATGAQAAGPTSSGEPMRCETGPVRKTYGGVPWLVYSCSDRVSLVIVSDEGSPAMPFYFMLAPKDAAYRLSGEGTGKKEATDAAFEDLEKLGPSDIAALIAETLDH